MKKLILLPFIFLACVPTPKAEKEVKADGYVIKTIDGCEYIECDYGALDQRVYSLTHKGNCSSPIHKTKNP